MSIACFYDFSTIRFENPLYIFFACLLELRTLSFTFISFNIKGIAIISLDIQPPIKKYRLAYPNP